MYAPTELHKTEETPIRDGSSGSRKYIRRFRRGESTAFVELIDSLKPKMRGAARAITRNPDDTDDVIQSAIVKAYSHFGQLRSNDKVAHWLMRITVNEARLHRRLAYNRLSSSFDSAPLQTQLMDPHHLALESLIREEGRRIVRKVIRRLEPHFRQVLILHYWKQAQVRDMSRVLGISESNVKTRLYRARQRVLTLLNSTREFDSIKGIASL
jgi:RNA polymerase sigma-70 factor, ECF subfamily